MNSFFKDVLSKVKGRNRRKSLIRGHDHSISTKLFDKKNDMFSLDQSEIMKIRKRNSAYKVKFHIP